MDGGLVWNYSNGLLLKTTINSQCTRFEGVYRRLVLTALAAAISATVGKG